MFKSFGNEKVYTFILRFSSLWRKQESNSGQHLSEQNCPLILRSDAHRLDFQDLITCSTQGVIIAPTRF